MSTDTLTALFAAALICGVIGMLVCAVCSVRELITGRRKPRKYLIVYKANDESGNGVYGSSECSITSLSETSSADIVLAIHRETNLSNITILNIVPIWKM